MMTLISWYSGWMPDFMSCSGQGAADADRPRAGGDIRGAAAAIKGRRRLRFAIGRVLLRLPVAQPRRPTNGGP